MHEQEREEAVCLTLHPHSSVHFSSALGQSALTTKEATALNHSKVSKEQRAKMGAILALRRKLGAFL